MAILNAIIKRRSVREFNNDPVSKEQVEEIIKAAQFAPTAMNNKGVEFLIIENQENKERIYEIAEPKQDFLKTAPILIIPVIDAKKSLLSIQDISVASENMLLQIASMGLGGVWRNISDETAEKIKEELGVSADFKMINIIPVGYPAKDTEDHKDEEFSEEKIHYEKW
jgi:nitroreductase